MPLTERALYALGALVIIYALFWLLVMRKR
jgi:hypothetical protein